MKQLDGSILEVIAGTICAAGTDLPDSVRHFADFAFRAAT